jgi:hypothetical protein
MGKHEEISKATRAELRDDWVGPSRTMGAAMPP